MVFFFRSCWFFTSCQQDIQTNTPSFQAKQNDVYWRANDARVSVDASGAMTITAFTQFETITLETSSSLPGVYVLNNKSKQLRFLFKRY